MRDALIKKIERRFVDNETRIFSERFVTETWPSLNPEKCLDDLVPEVLLWELYVQCPNGHDIWYGHEIPINGEGWDCWDCDEEYSNSNVYINKTWRLAPSFEASITARYETCPTCKGHGRVLKDGS